MMETQSALKKVIWLLAGSAVMLAAILVIGGTLLISCESEKFTALDFNKEQPIAWGNCLVNTPGCNDRHLPKIMTANGPVSVTTRLISWRPHNAMPQTNEDALKDRVFLGHDFEPIARPRGVSFDADKTRDEIGIGNWPDHHFLGQP